MPSDKLSVPRDMEEHGTIHVYKPVLSTKHLYATADYDLDSNDKRKLSDMALIA